MRFDVTGNVERFDGTVMEVAVGDATSIELCKECGEKLAAATKIVTTRLVCTRALTAITQKTTGLSGEDRFTWGRLAAKIYENDKPSLDVDEIKILRQAIGWNEGPQIVYRMRMLFEPPDEPNSSKSEASAEPD